MQTSTAVSLRKRTRLRVEEIREILRRQEASGMSLHQYCKEQALPYKSIASWRRRLSHPGAEQTFGALFVPVEVKGEIECSPGGADVARRRTPVHRVRPAVVEICLVHGRRLRLRADVDGATLRRFVEMLEAVPC